MAKGTGMVKAMRQGKAVEFQFELPRKGVAAEGNRVLARSKLQSEVTFFLVRAAMAFVSQSSLPGATSDELQLVDDVGK